GRQIVSAGERLVSRMPIIRTVHGALKQILETVLQQSSRSFRQVVLVEFPRRGLWALAFMTGDTHGEVEQVGGEPMVALFLPTTPNPTTGYLMFAPRRDVVFLEMTVEEAAKAIISAGVIMPTERAEALVGHDLRRPAEDELEKIGS